MRKEIVICGVGTQDQHADIFTKALPKAVFEKFRNKIMGEPIMAMQLQTGARLNMFQAGGNLVCENQEDTPIGPMDGLTAGADTEERKKTYYVIVQGLTCFSQGIYSSWARAAAHVRGDNTGFFKVHSLESARNLLTKKGVDFNFVPIFEDPVPVGDGICCYAVAFAEGVTGVFKNWYQCKKVVKNKRHAVYQKCSSTEAGFDFVRVFWREWAKVCDIRGTPRPAMTQQYLQLFEDEVKLEFQGLLDQAKKLKTELEELVGRVRGMARVLGHESRNENYWNLDFSNVSNGGVFV